MNASSEMDAGFSLGSNIGDKAGNIRHAFRELETSGLLRDLKLSSLYRTAPWGNLDQDWFVNACAAGRTSASPEELLALCLGIETSMGRERVTRWGPRNIDVDLLYCGDRRRETPDLRLPHPEMLNRAFVLVPLAEIRPALAIGGAAIRDAVERLGAAQIQPLAEPVINSSEPA